YSNWIASITTTPAQIMGLDAGKLLVDRPADLIIFPARYFSELLARSQHQRIVVRQGKAINAPLPDYRELDDLVRRA
ncbi:MAG: cytosine deaminase, partial [Cyanobacteria bacterium J06623_1]